LLPKRRLGPTIYLVVLTAALVYTSPSARAQDDVAGSPAVFSSPKKDPPPEAPKVKAPDQTDKIRVQSPLVATPVTVLDSGGEFVLDLGQEDFKVLDNGKPQRIERFDTSVDTVAAVILVQTNDLVEGLLDQVRPLGSVFSNLMLGPKGKAAVLFFADGVTLAQDFSNDSALLATTLRGVKAFGRLARLNDALNQAISLLEKEPKSERRLIVAFSEGFDKGSETTKEEIVRKATHAGVTIYGLGFNPAQALLLQKPQEEAQSPLDTNMTRPLPPGVVPTPTNSARVYSTPIPGVPIMTATGEIIRSNLASSLLEYYAGYTGGVFHSHWSTHALQDQLNRIASEVNSQYELAYVPDNLTETGFHRIQVEVKRPGVKVRTRAGYFVGQ